MLAISVIIYLILNLAIGFYAARKVRTSEDYILAGRRMPLYITAAALFATWYGSETVLGASGRMAEGGLYEVVEDPFGATLCLVLLAIFFIRPFYRMKILTFGDFYRDRFGKKVELVAGFTLVISYIGWIAAQMAALGLIMNAVLGIPFWTGTIIGSLVVIVYTLYGGMVSVTVLDFVQNIIIILGLFAVLIFVCWELDLVDFYNRMPEGSLDIRPRGGLNGWFNWLAMWFTIGLGSLPQQDIFQRMLSANSERTAVRAAWVAAGMYLTVGMIPVFLGAFVSVYHPGLLREDPENSLSLLVMNYLPVLLQVMFFGALLSAIMSTASGAILAPSAVFAENVFKPLLKVKTDSQLLLLTRLSVVILSVLSLALALGGGSVYDLVGQSSAFTLVSLFVPMIAGLWWKRANAAGAMLSIFLGMSAWIFCALLETEINPRMYGLGFSILGMIAGAFLFPAESEKPGSTLPAQK